MKMNFLQNNFFEQKFISDFQWSRKKTDIDEKNDEIFQNFFGLESFGS